MATSGNKSHHIVPRDPTRAAEVMDITDDGAQTMEVPSLMLPTLEKTILQLLGQCAPVTCDQCSFTTEFKMVTDSHEHTHISKQDKTRTFWCPHCEYSCDKVLQLQIHIQCHKERSRIRLYQCGFCTFLSNQVELIEDHIDDHHGNLKLKYEVTELQCEELLCPNCPTTLRNEITLLEHLGNQHGLLTLQNHLQEMYTVTKMESPERENKQPGSERKDRNDEDFAEVQIKKPAKVSNIRMHDPEEMHEGKGKSDEHTQPLMFDFSSVKKEEDQAPEEYLPSVGADENGSLTDKGIKHEDGADDAREDVVMKEEDAAADHVECGMTHQSNTVFGVSDDVKVRDRKDPQFDTSPSPDAESKDMYLSNTSLQLLEDLLHKSEENGVPFKCPVSDCPYSSAYKAEMQSHLQTHREPKEQQKVEESGWADGQVTPESGESRALEKKLLVTGQATSDQSSANLDPLDYDKGEHLVTVPRQPLDEDENDIIVIQEGVPAPGKVLDRAQLKGESKERVIVIEPTLEPEEDTVMAEITKAAEEYTDSRGVIGKGYSTDRVVEAMEDCSEMTAKEDLGAIHPNLQQGKIHTDQHGDFPVPGPSSETSNGTQSGKHNLIPGRSTKVLIQAKSKAQKLYSGFQPGTKTTQEKGPLMQSSFTSDVEKEVNQGKEKQPPSFPGKQSNLEMESIPYAEDLPIHGNKLQKQSSSASDVLGGSVWFSCEKCPYTSRHKNLIKDHVMGHLEYKPFTCSYCSFAAIRSRYVETHSKKQHPSLTPNVKKIAIPAMEASILTGFKRTRVEDVVKKERKAQKPSVKNKEEDEPMMQHEVHELSKTQASTSDVNTEKVWFSCKICSHTTRQKNLMKEHVMSHLKYKPWKCSYCSFSGIRSNYVRNHSKAKHPNVPPTVKKNKIQKMELWIQNSFTRKTDGDELEAKQSKIEQALLSNRQSQVITEPKNNPESIGVDGQKLPEEMPGPSSINDGTVWFSCNQCSYTTEKKNRIRDHVMRHLQYKPFKCFHCSFSGITLNPVKIHSKRQHPNVQPTVKKITNQTMELLLQKSFTKITIDEIQVKQEEQSQPNQNTESGRCQLSSRQNETITEPKRYTTNQSLDNKELPMETTSPFDVDDDTVRFSCNQCSYTTPNKNRIKQHVMCHLKYKPFKCFHCPFRSITSNPVKIHSKRHHPNLPPTVKKIKNQKMELSVQKSFTRKADGDEIQAKQNNVEQPQLPVRQSQIITEPRKGPENVGVDGQRLPEEMPGPSNVNDDTVWFSCNQCSYTTQKKNRIRDHVMSHLEYKPFKCFYCSFRSITSNPVKNHSEKKHPTLPVKYKKIPNKALDSSIQNLFTRKTSCDEIQVKQDIPKQHKSHPTPQKIARVQPQPQAETPAKSATPKVPEASSEVAGRTQFACKRCSYMTQYKNAINCHVMAHLEYKPFRCSYCSFSGIRSNAVKIHSEKQHPNSPPIVGKVTDPTKELSIPECFTTKTTCEL